ncbi:MAG: LysR family transcriptional regulator, transcriptional activator for dmlA [Pseudomonadota bacterium]|nr:LysR family transcriptional regulator, transcriptional activator for dmlA [Pseudomonadota bacterium]
MFDDLRLGDLKTFGLVIRHGGFSAASRACATPQTTISKRVASLEQALGVKLLHRTPRQVRLTEDGQRVYAWVRRLLDDVSDMGDELAAARGEPVGPLRISASMRLGRAYVAPVLAALKRDHPALDITLDIVDRPVNLVAEGLHLDVRTGEPTEPGLIGHRIFCSERILCASPDYLRAHGQPSDFEALREHRCLLFKDRIDPPGLWRLHGPRGWETMSVRSDLTSNDNEVVLTWAEAGLGIMLATDWFFADSLASGRLARVLPGWSQPADVWVVSASRTAQSAKVRVFIERLRAEMAARLAC